jgi:hypothetical protein
VFLITQLLCLTLTSMMNDRKKLAFRCPFRE